MADLVNVTADLRGFDRWASSAIARQVPFATAKSLSQLAVLARNEVRAELPHRFKIRSGWVARGVQAVPAQKSDFPNESALVGVRDEFMLLQETGGQKRARSSQNVAIPSKFVDQQRTGGGRVPARLKPRALIDSGKGFKVVEEIRLRQSGERARVAFFLRPRAEVKPAFGFRETVEAVVERHHARVFRAALEAALEPRRA